MEPLLLIPCHLCPLVPPRRPCAIDAELYAIGRSGWILRWGCHDPLYLLFLWGKGDKVSRHSCDYLLQAGPTECPKMWRFWPEGIVLFYPLSPEKNTLVDKLSPYNWPFATPGFQCTLKCKVSVCHFQSLTEIRRYQKTHQKRSEVITHVPA